MNEEEHLDGELSRGRSGLLGVALLALGGLLAFQNLTGHGGSAANDALPPGATVAGTRDPDLPAHPTTPPTTLGASPTSSPPTTSAAQRLMGSGATPNPSVAPVTAAPQPGSVLPNGVAIGAVVSFDGEVVSMRGSLPSELARNRLLMLVTAANTAGRPIRNEVTVDPNVPGGDSVRVIGLDPQAFPEGTEDIYAAHAAELDRVAGLLNAFPNVTVVVVGRSDQRGPSERNLGIAERRADALVAYLVSRGVEPSRLLTLALGELQPTSQAEDETALALNRRAEFILYGLAR